MRNDYAQSCAPSSVSLPTAVASIYAQYCDMPRAEQVAFREYIDLVMERTGLPDPTAVAKKAGLAPSTVNKPYGRKEVKWEVSNKTIKKIAEATGVPPPKTLLPLPDPYKIMAPAALDSRSSIGQVRPLTKMQHGRGVGRTMSDATLIKAIQRLVECNSWEAVFDAVMQTHPGETPENFRPARHRGK